MLPCTPLPPPTPRTLPSRPAPGRSGFQSHSSSQPFSASTSHAIWGQAHANGSISRLPERQGNTVSGSLPGGPTPGPHRLRSHPMPPSVCPPPWSVNGALGAQEQRAWNQADCVCLWGQGPVPTASERGLWFPRRDSQREGWGRQRCGHQGTWVQTPTGDSASFWKAPHLRFPTCSVERTMLLRALPGLVPGLPRWQRCGGRSGISAWQLSGPPNHLRARELALLGGERGEPLPSHLGLEGSGMGVGRRRWFPLWLRPPDMLGRPRTFLPSGPQFPHL